MPLPINLRRAERILEGIFDTTGTVMRKSEVHDTSGGMTDSYTSIGTFPCMFVRSNVTPRENENAYTIQHISYWTFSFPARTDISTTDRIVCNGRTFEVVGGRSGSFELATRVTCIELL